MKFLKKKEGIIISFIIGVILASSITVYAYSYFAKDISYTKPGTDTAINVETALNELYTKSNAIEEIIYPYIFGSGNACTAYFNFSDIRNKKIYINCRETNNLNNTSTAKIYIGTSLNGNTWTHLTNVTGINQLDVESLISTYSINITTQPYLIFNNSNYNGYSILQAK